VEEGGRESELGEESHDEKKNRKKKGRVRNDKYTRIREVHSRRRNYLATVEDSESGE